MEQINYNDEDIISHHGVAAVIKNKDNKILMQKHIKFGFWTIPVGKVRNDQSVKEGLKEEILEECNIKILKFEEIANKKMWYNRDGNKVIVDSHLFMVDEFSGEVKNNEPEKHLEIKFMGIVEICKLKHVSDMTLLYLRLVGEKPNHDYDGKVL